MENDNLYSGIEAQSDPEFHSDGMTEQEVQELLNYVSLYHPSQKEIQDILPDYLKDRIK